MNFSNAEIQLSCVSSGIVKVYLMCNELDAHFVQQITIKNNPIWFLIYMVRICRKIRRLYWLSMLIMAFANKD